MGENDTDAVDCTDATGSVGRSSVSDEENILNTVNPLHGLGECVIETTLAANPLPPPQPPPTVPAFSLRICMCGRALTGKSEQAIRLADRYCLKVISSILFVQSRGRVVKKVLQRRCGTHIHITTTHRAGALRRRACPKGHGQRCKCNGNGEEGFVTRGGARTGSQLVVTARGYYFRQGALYD